MFASVLAEFLACCQNAYFPNAGLAQGSELHTVQMRHRSGGFDRSVTPDDTVTLPPMTAELDQLREVLDGMRAGVLKKLAGLSDQDARRSTVDSGTNLAGLVQHLTFVESMWFEEVVAGGSATRGDRSMQVGPSVRSGPYGRSTALLVPPATRSSRQSGTRKHR